MIISVASGKGGTGKTTLSTGLAWIESLERSVHILDCDVEEPDAHFYVKPDWVAEKEVLVPVPVVDEQFCDGCGRCADFCKYNALAVIQRHVLIFPELCHGCGGCLFACPQGCIRETHRRIGVIRGGRRDRITLFQGILDIGEPVAVPVIRELKALVTAGALTIIDSPPGTGCTMLSAIEGSDYCVLVTEPSPFGKHDLELAHSVALELDIRHGVVINKASAFDPIIEEYCVSEGITLLGKIPYEKSVAESCSRGDILPEISGKWHDAFLRIFEEVIGACLSSL